MFDFLSHYYQEFPFLNISDLTKFDRKSLLARLAKVRSLPYRLTCSSYFVKRKSIEDRIRAIFAGMGGKPIRRTPHYMVLGESMYWQGISQHCLKVPLSTFDSEMVSFTFSDSFYTFSSTTLKGIPIPDRPHRSRVYNKEEISHSIDKFGLPLGYSDTNEEFEVYIEAQIWDDTPLMKYLSPVKSGDLFNSKSY